MSKDENLTIEQLEEELAKLEEDYEKANLHVPDGREGERIRELRAREKYSARQFAARLGVRQPTVNSWETGRVKPPIVAVKAIAYEFGVSENWLLTGAGDANDAANVTRKRLISWINNMSGTDVITLSRLLRVYSER